MTNSKLLANRRNALQSTGPNTLAGRERSSRNALRHGFYTAAVVPAAGESVEEFEALRASVHEELAPEGILAGRLADRVALILWRFDRVVRYETATVAYAVGALAASPLPADPDRITGDEIDICIRVPENATPAYRLAFARARIKGWEPVRTAFQNAATALRGGDGTELLPAGAGIGVRRELGALLGWTWEEGETRWNAAVAARKNKPPLTGSEFKKFVESLVRAVGVDPTVAIPGMCERLTAKAAEYDAVIAEKEREVVELVPQMRAARAAALAAGLYSDDDAIERVMRAEAHLTRQLGLTLDLLGRLRGGSEAAAPIEVISRLAIGR